MNNVSFQSRIRPISKREFSKITSSYGQAVYVNYPWTIKESVLSNKAYTKGVFDCTVCGITDGIRVLMLHICPTKKENENFDAIASFIKSKIDLTNSNLQGFLLGSKKLPFLKDKSQKIFDNFENFFEKYKIPYSKIKGGLHDNDVAYSSITDEWLISHEMLEDENIKDSHKTPEKFLEHFYNDVKISELDELVW